ncbi:fasciclin domain family [Podospora didyma]|uniref:Fasciclin domain family n=1 Tax=Podospora didyma TaxID=330526 RepID=A0AAE0P654_9PEZI|nr:fasciclin domain family [Podospora didyma]
MKITAITLFAAIASAASSSSSSSLSSRDWVTPELAEEIDVQQKWNDVGGTRELACLANQLSGSDKIPRLSIDSALEQVVVHSDELDSGGGGGHHHHGDASKTIYELIKESKYTTRFAKLVDKYDDIKDLLSDTEKSNHTLFVPTDRAFEHIPDHDDDDDEDDKHREFIHSALLYHIAPGLYPVRRVLLSHTIASNLTLSTLGTYPQRIRVGISLLRGVRFNFWSKLVAGNIIAKNGVIHAVDAILVPPPPTAKIIQLLPGTFSTLSLGFEKTGLEDELADLPHYGGTLFAPTNRAFTKLGRRANAFLFSEHGKRYLKALLRYHVVANETLYSDAYYKKKSEDDDDDDENIETAKLWQEEVTPAGVEDYWHIDLPSLLNDKAINVDVRRWRGFISILINGRVRVAVQDGVASDGVVQVVNSVLIPPHRHPHHGGDDEGSLSGRDGEVNVDELKERLEPYLAENEEESARGGKRFVDEDL